MGWIFFFFELGFISGTGSCLYHYWWDNCFILGEKRTSCACVLVSGWKLLAVLAVTLLKSLCKLFTDKFILSTTQIWKISSAKSLEFVANLSETLFIFIMNNNDPMIDLCSMLALMLDHKINWITLCFPTLKVLKRLPNILFCLNLKIKPLCCAFSKALDMSKNTDQINCLDMD